MMNAIGRAAAALALLLAAGVHPVAAQEVSPQACADIKENIRYLVNEGAFIQEASVKNGVDLLAGSILVRNAACGTPGDDSYPPPTPNDPPAPPPTPVPAPTPVAAPTPIADDSNPLPRPDACLLVTANEVGAAMKQGVTASADDPLGVPTPGVQGCDFNGAGDAHTTIMYFQANGASFYDDFHTTAALNGVQSVPGLGDRAFAYSGGGGPGVVVAKGDKIFALEFSGIGSGPTEQSSLLTLAQQAVNRVH